MKDEIPTGSTEPSKIIHEPGRYQAGPHTEPPPTFQPPWMAQPGPESSENAAQAATTGSGGPGHKIEEVPVVESFAGDGAWVDDSERLPKPMRYAFADMSGVVFGVWIPVLLAFFLPWNQWGSYPKLFAGMDAGHVVVALIIAIPPWYVLTRHLLRGRLWDGILDMLLWAIWESLTMIALCYLYPDRAQHVIWNASN
jgi:hypothetical protein